MVMGPIGIVLNDESVNSPLTTSGVPAVCPCTVSVPAVKGFKRSEAKNAEKLAW